MHYSMAENLEIDSDMLPVMEIRISDAQKKTSFRVRRLKNFPVAETVEEMKSALQIFMPDINYVENWQLGYILDRNKKYTIETDGELRDAFDYVKRGYQMWLDPSPRKIGAPKRRANNINGQGKLIVYMS